MQAEYPEAVATTWSLSFGKTAQAEPACPELLAALAFLYPEAIPEEILTEGYVHLGELLGPQAADPLLWDRVIAQRLRCPMITYPWRFGEACLSQQAKKEPCSGQLRSLHSSEGVKRQALSILAAGGGILPATRPSRHTS
jgi:hypothetical protein